MADDKHSDLPDESDESTPLPPTGAELADEDLPAAGATALGGQADGAPQDDADELTTGRPIADDQAGDGYADDPTTDDVNEAKLDRATDAAAAEPTVDPGSTAQRRPRSSRPTRRKPVAGRTDEAPVAETTDDELPPELADEAGSGAVATRTPRRTVARKDHAVAARKQHTPTSGRVTPGSFVSESAGELRKVVWPTGNQVQQYFVVVLVFVLFIIAFVSLLDLAFGWALLKVFG